MSTQNQVDLRSITRKTRGWLKRSRAQLQQSEALLLGRRRRGRERAAERRAAEEAFDAQIVTDQHFTLLRDLAE